MSTVNDYFNRLQIVTHVNRQSAIEDAYEAYIEGCNDGDLYAEIDAGIDLVETFEAGYVDGYNARKDDVHDAWKDGYKYGYGRPVDTGYLVNGLSWVRKDDLVTRIRLLIRTHRQDAYKTGFEHAERLYKQYQPKSVIAITRTKS